MREREREKEFVCVFVFVCVCVCEKRVCVLHIREMRARWLFKRECVCERERES